MRNPALFSRIFNTPLMIQPMKLDAIVAGIGPRFGLDGLMPNMALTQSGERKRPGYEVIGSVAVIDIIGVLAHRSDFDANCNYILGYETIGKQLNAALADPTVRSILLQIDSPGGEVAGAFELAAQIKAAREQKPIHAVISSMAASAGYLIASAAGQISISETGIAGSIGVVLRHIDVSQMAANEGVKVTYVFAGGHKIDGNPYEPLPDDVRASLQAEMDHLHSLFVSTVAGNRNKKESDIRAQEADTYTGKAAIDAGLADRIATPDEIVAEMQTLSSTKTRGITMSAPDATAALDSAALEKSRAEGFTAGKQEGIAAGAAAERQRIAAIFNTPAAIGRQAQAKVLALETDMSAEIAEKVLASMPITDKPEAIQPGGNAFAQHMAKIGNPDIGPGAEEGDQTDAQLAANIVALHHNLRGGKK